MDSVLIQQFHMSRLAQSRVTVANQIVYAVITKYHTETYRAHQTLPFPCMLLKVIHARFGWVWLARLKYCKHFNSHGPGLLDSGPVSVHNDGHDGNQQKYEAQCQHTHSNRCIVKGRQTQGRLICWGC